MWCLHLPIDLPSANRHIVNGRDRRTGAMYAAARNRYARDLRIAALAAGLPLAVTAVTMPPMTVAIVRPVAKRRVRCVRLMAGRQRPWDAHDNLPAAFKALVDAMQVERVHVGKGKVRTLIRGAGILMDDSARWVEVEYAQERAPDDRPGVRLEIADQLSIPEAA